MKIDNSFCKSNCYNRLCSKHKSKDYKNSRCIIQITWKDFSKECEFYIKPKENKNVN